MSEDISQLGRYRADSEVGRLRAEIERLNAEVARLQKALQDIFDYECQFSSTSLIACTARDALWPSQLPTALAGEEKT